MHRLSKNSFHDFFASASGPSAILIGAPAGEATMARALEFAVAWTNSTAGAFAYIDAFDEVDLARKLGVRVLPTILIMAGRRVVTRFEEPCSSEQILEAMEQVGRADRSVLSLRSVAPDHGPFAPHLTHRDVSLTPECL